MNIFNSHRSVFKLNFLLLCAAFASVAGSDVQQESTTSQNSPPDSIAELLASYDGNTLIFDEDTIDFVDPSVLQYFPNVTAIKVSQRVRSLQSNTFEWAKTLTQVLLDDNLLTAIPKKAISVLPSLATLSIGNNRLEALGDGDEFVGLDNLKCIVLERNFISTLHPLTFASSRALKELYLQENRLTSLDGLVLPDENHLEVLDLSKNYLKHVNESVFARMHGLKELSLAGNLFETLRASSFADLHALKRLNLDDNFLKTLPPKLFISNRQLVELKVAENQLVKLPVNVFAGLKNLQILHLHSNQLTHVPDETFRDQPEFEELTLFRNRIANFERSFLKCSEVLVLYNRLRNLWTASFVTNMTVVETVNLYSNEIETIEQGVFDGLPNMKVLHMAENRIAELSPSLFQNNHALVHVSFAHNRLSVLRTKTFSRMPQLNRVDLSHNQLSVLEPAVFYDSSVVSVNLQGNQLTTLNDWVFSGAELFFLNLNSNALESIETDGGYLNQLRTLSAASNRVTSWQDFCSENFTNLWSIDLTNNSLTSIEGGCFDRRRGRRNSTSISVSVGYNKLSAVPVLAEHVELLDLSDNNLSDLGDGNEFQSYVQLDELMLENTSLRALRTVSFTHLQHLKRLLITSSVLEHIDEDVLHGLKLQWLRLNNSPLKTLPPSLLKGQDEMNGISLANTQLTQLASGFFADCLSLTEIDLSYNKLESVDPLWFEGLKNLKWIFLDGNRIAQLPPNLLSTQQTYLGLTMAGNALRSIGDAHFLANLSISDLNFANNQLEDVDILEGNNFISELDVSGNRLKRLLVRSNYRVLTANSNQITSLQWEPDTKFMLQKLQLAGNLLEEVDPQTFDIITLKELDVSENRLNTFPFGWVYKLQQLESLIVSRNNIRTLPSLNTAQQFKLETLDLSENPLEEQPNNFLASCVVKNLTITVAK
uniref:Uncharacterized protein n=1 Tax=Anopheles culicifacies TaxID=139723 RepID=A0A182LRN7_9DIPT